MANSLTSKDPLYLKVLDIFSSLYEKSGVDYKQLRLIVKTKILMDGREPNLIMQNGKNKEEKNAFFSSLIWYAIISSFVIGALFVSDSLIMQYTIYFGYLFVMLLSTTIASFSAILLDAKDQVLIGTKPVSGQTLSAAKATHVFVYLFSLTLALGGPVTIATYFVNGLLAGLLVTILTVIFSFWTLLFTLVIYATILKKFNGEKLKNIISYSQIGLSIFTILGYQLVSQLFSLVDFAIVYQPKIWHLPLFPLWFAAPLGLLQEGMNGYYLFYTLLFITATTLFFFYYRKNSAQLERNIQKLTNQNENLKEHNYWMNQTKTILCSNSTEQAYYQFTWKIIQNEREFKTRVYPPLAVSFILPLFFSFNSLASGMTFTDLRNQGFPFAVYITLFMVPQLVASLNYSSSYKGAWIFQMSPVNNDGLFVRAAGKTVWMRLIVPFYVALSVFLVFLYGWNDLAIILNGFLATTVVFFGYLKLAMKSYPFSKEFTAADANRGFMPILVLLFITGLFGLANFLLDRFLPFGSWIMTLLLLISTFYYLFGKHKLFRFSQS
ncbi:hypothetical protein SAMN04488700_1680 [Carnobacterium iners]|uniref:ABC-2 type transport system permease protein n=1 Tax=Carnobacterium iners TaxID=1073423 RepID=A0A1X7NAH5_9LACT|nr:hypothetical protein [Carnobacterium iners]SEK51347.1 hypothetical protein SAMN04488114_10542 [Carnobacterium iners]SMH34600.1 hypothetical protein SAMN04488700_1680 [Carnobacterium iners]